KPVNIVPRNDFRRDPLCAKNPSQRNSGYSLPASAYGCLCSLAFFLALLPLAWPVPCPAQEKVSGPPLAGTQPLAMEGDIAAQMVAGIDKFLLREIDLSVERREKFWKRDFSSLEAYNKS